MSSNNIAKQIIDTEVFYFGQKGLETTQRCSIQASIVRKELLRINAPKELVDLWIEVGKQIYKIGK